MCFLIKNKQTTFHRTSQNAFLLSYINDLKFKIHIRLNNIFNEAGSTLGPDKLGPHRLGPHLLWGRKNSGAEPFWGRINLKANFLDG